MASSGCVWIGRSRLVTNFYVYIGPRWVVLAGCSSTCIWARVAGTDTSVFSNATGTDVSVDGFDGAEASASSFARGPNVSCSRLQKLVPPVQGHS